MDISECVHVLACGWPLPVGACPTTKHRFLEQCLKGLGAPETMG
jgi:hypothetical protein